MKTIQINIEDNELIKKTIETDIEMIYPNDKDYKKLEKYRKERELHPENYLSEESIKF